jgi:hypothetical protein
MDLFVDLKVPAVGGSQWTTAERQREEKSLCGNDLQTLLDFCGSPQNDAVERVMGNSAEQLGTVGLGLVGPAAQVVGQQRVGPARPVQVAVAAVEYGQAADQAEAQVASVGAGSPRIGDRTAAASTRRRAPTVCSRAWVTFRPQRLARSSEANSTRWRLKRSSLAGNLPSHRLCPSSIVAFGRAPPMLVPGSSCSSKYAATCLPSSMACAAAINSSS